VTFTLAGREPVEIKQFLARQHINVTVSEQKSTLLDLSERGLVSLVRASIHYYNSQEEIERFCQALEMLV
jgi:selenocysteine lyase/cysteine desulfurase